MLNKSKELNNMNNYVCDECTSSNIELIKDKDNEMDCYCNDCNTEQYIVSEWWINKNIQGARQ